MKFLALMITSLLWLFFVLNSFGFFIVLFSDTLMTAFGPTMAAVWTVFSWFMTMVCMSFMQALTDEASFK
jgi:hypothetical protein